MRAATGTGAVHAESRRTARLPLLVAGGLSLLVGTWVGLRRAGWRFLSSREPGSRTTRP